MTTTAHPTSRRRLARRATAAATLAVTATAALAGPAFAATSSTAAKRGSGIVDVWTTLGYQGGEAAGTGIVLTSTGEILTNNHVIAGATSISVTDVDNGKRYDARVLGYSRTADVAVLQLTGATGLPTATLGTVAQLGQWVAAAGNAQGHGGAVRVAGHVTATNQAITAYDDSTGSSEALTGLLETDAAIQPGDSGGPLLNSRGAVIGMTTAGSTSGSNPYLASTPTNGFAIPIWTATALARQIEAGRSSASVHVGASAMLGVQVATSRWQDGVVVVGTLAGGPAANAGIPTGAQLVMVDGRAIGSQDDLTTALVALHPGQRVSLRYVDPYDGTEHSVTVTLTTGAAQ